VTGSVSITADMRPRLDRTRSPAHRREAVLFPS
jgi:hypothetical protein